MNDPANQFIKTAQEEGFVLRNLFIKRSQSISHLENLIIEIINRGCEENGLEVQYESGNVYQRDNELIFLGTIDVVTRSFDVVEGEDYSGMFSLRELNEDRRIVGSVVRSLVENVREIQVEDQFDKFVMENYTVGLRLDVNKFKDGRVNMNYIIHPVIKGTIVNIGNRRTKSAKSSKIQS